MVSDACETPRRPSYLEEIALARELVDAGDREHALFHCTSALALEPNRSEWRSILRDLLRDASLLAKLTESPFVGSQAARAYHLHETGELVSAIELLANVHVSAPHRGFFDWLTAWIEEANAKAVTPALWALVRVLSLGIGFGIGRMRLLPAETALAEELSRFARSAMKSSAAGEVAFLASAIFRRARLYDEAVDAAERARSAMPESHLIAKGLALRGKRDFDGALATFDEAWQVTRDPMHLAEKYRVLADAGRWPEAIAAFHHFASLHPPGDENVADYAVIEAAANANAPPPDAPPLDVVRRRALGHGGLLAMTDATANGLRQLGADPRYRENSPRAAGEAIRGTAIRMTVSGVESPSNRLCLTLVVTGSTDPNLVEYTCTSGAMRADSVLWRTEGDVVVQAMAPPSSAVVDWIERIALRESDGSTGDTRFESTPDFLDLWTMAAAERTPKSRARDWLAATVHPRMPVSRVAAGPEWLYRWQVVALLGLVFSEPGWRGTEKREALLSLLRDEDDWPHAAAIRVAAELALHEPETTCELRQELIDLSAAPKGGNTAIGFTLLEALSMLPYVAEEYVETIRVALKERGAFGGPEQEANADEARSPEPSGSGDPSPTASASAKPWWNFW